MKFIKLTDFNGVEIYLKTSKIKLFHLDQHLDQQSPDAKTIGYISYTRIHLTDKSFLGVKETPEMILKILEE